RARAHGRGKRRARAAGSDSRATRRSEVLLRLFPRRDRPDARRFRTHRPARLGQSARPAEACARRPGLPRVAQERRNSGSKKLSQRRKGRKGRQGKFLYRYSSLIFFCELGAFARVLLPCELTCRVPPSVSVISGKRTTCVTEKEITHVQLSCAALHRGTTARRACGEPIDRDRQRFRVD